MRNNVVIPEAIKRWLSSPGQGAPLLLTAESAFPWAELLRAITCFSVCTATEDMPCLVCAACQQVQAGSHPDVIHLTPVDTSISITQVREFLRIMSLAPAGLQRLAVIFPAEKLGREASYALLKQLEELSESTHMLLATSYPNRLLTTIRSRCLRIHVRHALHARPVSDSNTMQQLLSRRQREALTDEELENVFAFTQEELASNPHRVNLQRVLLRLRDYYKIRAFNGNTKLAADVLLASLGELKNT